jgi:spore coat polysaccharide biosynthesis protein SpsF (cytidylyltransferase family)
MTGILVIVRLGSKRLHNKHLISTSKGRFLEILLFRIKQEFTNEIADKSIKLIIATSDEMQNLELNQFRTDVYFGVTHNIPLRQLQCAEKYGLNKIISIDGDDVLCSPEAMRDVYNTLNSRKQFVCSENYPLGMNVMGYTTKFLSKYLEKNLNKILVTGWGRIFENATLSKIPSQFDNFPHHRYTLDYSEDSIFLKKVIENIPLNEITTERILNDVELYKWYEINSYLSDEYLKNFNKEKENEF